MVRVSISLGFEFTCPHERHKFNLCKHIYAVVLRMLENAGINVEN